MTPPRQSKRYLILVVCTTNWNTLYEQYTFDCKNVRAYKNQISNFAARNKKSFLKACFVNFIFIFQDILFKGIFCFYET